MKISFPQYLLIFLLLITFPFPSFASEDQTHPDEVEALKVIAKTLGKEDWNFSVDPCRDWLKYSLYCNCSIANDNFCHVVEIYLGKQSLPGKLPPELAKLPYLDEINFSGNYLNGTIPPEWGSLNLNYLQGNRLTGQIPVELAKITTLVDLDLRFNQFSGKLPPQLGNLPGLRRLYLSSNNFTGGIPATFARLTTLTDFVIGDNQFSGKIPDFIGSWTNLQILIIQGSGLSGPIPSGISFLINITDLRISDLNGSDSTFPQLNNLTNLETLILRSCNINGSIPDYLGTLENLTTLDLSYNKLSGQVGGISYYLVNLKYLYLTRNFLTGPAPEGTPENTDISYNNFDISNQGEQTCLGGSYTCNRSIKCPKTSYSFHINCGGDLLTIGNTTYDNDLDEAGPTVFKLGGSGTNWAFRNTGHFFDVTKSKYIAQNQSRLSIPNFELYMNARVSPISLTYYGFCLGNGSYTVSLHFAEIMFTDDKTYGSPGRRVFDIYIQGKLVLKDFNIANEAQGVGKAITKIFTGVVTNNTLEIHFYWAGKGTNDVPYNLVYGPLISAISVNPDFKLPLENQSSITEDVVTITGKVVAAIVCAGVIIVILAFGILWWSDCLGKRSSLARELNDLNLQIGLFTLRQIKAATNDFDISNKIGEGGFGPVYKGILSDGSIIAVKQLSSKSKQGNREFINEVGMISALQHSYLVKLYGCCVEGDQLLLVYEYMENNSLARALFGSEECCLKLDWPTRCKICVGIARGLAFLHEESRLKIVHRDIKATNVLLDKDLNPKISDFGLAKLDEEDNTHISTRIAGTYGYMAPEYAMHGYLTDKADVYSFGIVALEIVSGRSISIHRQQEEYFYLLDWAHLLKENGNLMELVDRRLGSDFNEDQAMVVINVALLCTNISSSLRPTMSSVLSMLEGKTTVPELIANQSEVNDKMKLEAMRRHYQQREEDQISETHTTSLLMNSSMTSSSST